MMNPDDIAANPYQPPRTAFEPEEGAEEDVVLASRFLRYIAFLVDYMILIVLLAVFNGVVSAFVMVPLANRKEPLPDTAAVTWVFITALGGVLLAFLYFAAQEASRHQATLGKRLFGMRVVRIDGDDLSLGRAVWRTFVKFFGMTFLYLGWIVALFNADRRALHDFAAGTVVVRRKAFGRKKDIEPIDEF
jgi:uncharacterized RDD family membrane protein YckC